MKQEDIKATRILLMFEGIRHIQSEQGIDSFDQIRDESMSIIDEIISFKYTGDNPNIQQGFQAIKFWHEGLKLIRQKISELEEDKA